MDLRDHLLIQLSTRDVYDALILGDRPHSGLVFTGQAAHEAVRMVRRRGYTAPVLCDRRRYAGSGRVRGTAGLSAHWIADQVEARVTVPLTDSGYIGRGDTEALHTILDQASQWGEVVAVLPVHADWLGPGLPALTTAIATYGLPVALVVEDAAPPPVRIPGLPLLSAGVAALGALAHGAPWAAVGVREVLRHLYPEPHQARGGWRKGGARSALVPELLEFVPVERLPEGVCGCSVCHGRPLRHLAGAGELEVNTHNVTVLHRLHARMLRSTHRERWWAELQPASSASTGPRPAPYGPAPRPRTPASPPGSADGSGTRPAAR
ncbi:hypothetical protein HNR40_009299 [Nonomuraea endophytica]|uniref:Uncharacterized protein n=1 Tax=Nonomuraea endophytica TaxID=714136 RepID=A0A7W8ADQ0_9ACTN|nr:hypothetical protein [Nonomuraea endophytica]